MLSLQPHFGPDLSGFVWYPGQRSVPFTTAGAESWEHGSSVCLRPRHQHHPPHWSQHPAEWVFLLQQCCWARLIQQTDSPTASPVVVKNSLGLLFLVVAIWIVLASYTIYLINLKFMCIVKPVMLCLVSASLDWVYLHCIQEWTFLKYDVWCLCG